MIMDLLLLSGSIVVVEFAFGRLGRETFPWGKELSLTTISSAQQPSFYSIFQHSHTFRPSCSAAQISIRTVSPELLFIF
jgi:hypothetical protein